MTNMIDPIKPHSRRQPPAQPHSSRATGARFTKLRHPKKRRVIAWDVVAAIVMSPLLFGLAFLGVVGEGIVVGCGIAALVIHWPSRNLFILALSALLYMLGLQLGGVQEQAQTMAALAYILLASGVISLAIEVRTRNRMWFKKH